MQQSKKSSCPEADSLICIFVKALKPKIKSLDIMIFTFHISMMTNESQPMIFISMPIKYKLIVHHIDNMNDFQGCKINIIMI